MNEGAIKEAWQEILEYDDRTSPEEYPEMVMITYAEFAGFMRRAAGQPISGREGDWEDIGCHVPYSCQAGRGDPPMDCIYPDCPCGEVFIKPEASASIIAKISPYNYDRYRLGLLMAEGITVHAASRSEADVKMKELFEGRYPGTDVMRFEGNNLCWRGCRICHPLSADGALPAPFYVRHSSPYQHHKQGRCR